MLPATSGGLGALLNSAPELIDRIQRLTERLTELLSDKNQNAISDILENIDKTRRSSAERAPDLADAIREIRLASHNAGIAADNFAALTDNTNRLVSEQGRPAMQNLNKAIVSARQAADNLDAIISDARPGRSELQQIDPARGQQTGSRPSRALAIAAGGVERVEQQGIGGALGPDKLPDYKPGKSE